MLRLEWVAGSNPNQLRGSAEKLLLLLRELAVRHFLLDMDSVPNLPLADQLWLGDHWMPTLVTLPLERLVLVIASSQIHNQFAARPSAAQHSLRVAILCRHGIGARLDNR